jgi:2-deoxy-D-gluconate 3-dehydrogenase
MVNNAGISHSYEALSYTGDEWSNMMEVNLTTVFDLSCQAVRLGCKRVIQIASTNAFNGARNIVGYSTAKHGLIGMTKCLSNEWAPLGVTVNNIAPGFIDTEMIGSITNNTKRTGEIVGRIPVGRLGTPKDLVGAMLFLASEEARYVTGTTLVVDGGWLGR